MRIELEANQSGRLRAEDLVAWKRLCTIEGCPALRWRPHPEWILAETDTRIIAGSEAVLPGNEDELRDPWQHQSSSSCAPLPTNARDVYVGYPNQCRARFTRTDEEIGRMRGAVRAGLAGRLRP